ncbi:MAG: respiratory nitrate reductase subunit gamma [Planctomycetes bacterium RBG_16_59_8]|nr:MAG: respiratory nitrate reductase subunit gamma [Planctomycetes bacterium RBG_16_59_8]
MTHAVIVFGIFPYVAIFLAIAVTIIRYVSKTYTWSSLSSQFLENRRLFWGSVPFHYGIILVLLGHFVGFLFPRELLAWNGVPWRLYILEATGLVLGLLALWGIIVLIARRIAGERVRVVTSTMDVILLVVLLIQIGTGVGTAIFDRWGSSWYAGSAAPYLWSVLFFRPDISLVANLPLLPQIHICGGFLVLALLPFTRLVHILSFPLPYLWRPHQVVIWNSRRKPS